MEFKAKLKKIRKEKHFTQKSLCEKLGLPHIRVHDIRHSYNTWLVEQYNTPEDLAAITKRLGRSSIKVTIDTYYHAMHDKENELVQGLNYDPKKK